MPQSTIEERRAYNNAWYASASQEAKDTKIARAAERKKENAVKVWAWKETHPCVDRGESDPIVLEFDHVVFPKKFEVSDGVGRGLSWATIVAEIEKCEMRCANCHRRVTYERRHQARGRR